MHSPIPLASISGLILSGGRGTRMGDIDKGLQLFQGIPLITHAIKRLTPQVSRLMINANRHTATYAQFGWPVLPDLFPNFAGPLAGLQSGLTHCDTEYLATVPCDSPCFPLDLVAQLAFHLHERHANAAIAVSSGSHRRHPVFCLLKTDMLPSLTHYLQDGGRKMDQWFSSIQAIDVYFEYEQAFSNINTIEELQKLENTITNQHHSDHPSQQQQVDQ